MPEPNAALRLLWGPPARPTRGPKPSLSLESIARAGVGVADAEGLAAVSMQRVAGLLDHTKMALYRYVPGKAELVALMVEHAAGDPPPASDAPWREQLADWAHRMSAVLAAHPWLLDALAAPRPTGPRELAWLERVVAALDGHGLSGAERMDAAVLLVGHVRTIAAQHRQSRDGSPEAELLRALGDLVQTHADRYPALAAALAEPPGGRDDAYDFGIARILDGIAALIDHRTR
ncbi:TetR family transcriptional regulator [Kitasatospora sp. SolWspMP-SS2h]|uniref:TetR/AcrR family transcriptional regulator n=1 Tax=Kitasatospora sp. SolWspMP-SS2h TaxID=1305729 RepID=UPI000DC02AD0|nr:TetR/AcrR family transcriptional regulator C-terminal domain-containing protein [Kitasatospora sp. SolWspMP-SS2h]RAJ46899.1 TetR family transcriptional regulator [Kitasatospora sp. SolWspMP-SS2h]